MWFGLLASGSLVMAGAQQIPALSPSDVARLALAEAQGRGHDDAFAALVEHLEAWPSPGEIAIDAEPVRRQADWDQLRADPAQLRGELFLVEGTLAMRNHVGVSYSPLRMEEWFIRSQDETVIAFVDVQDDGGSWKTGQQDKP